MPSETETQTEQFKSTSSSTARSIVGKHPAKGHASLLPRCYDSLICYIPMNVTADLGVAMKRVRKRRCEKFRKLFPPPKRERDEEEEGKDDEDKDKGGDNGGGGDAHSDGDVDGSQKSGVDGTGKHDDSDADGESQSQERSPSRRRRRTEKDAEDESMMDKIGTEIRREQFSSIVDYLEAKYSKGVMIDDLDERVREKKRQTGGAAGGKGKSGGAGGGGGRGTSANGDDLSVLSDSEAGSCYSDDSGNFIDDSELRTDVAHQILASSAFGTTKIEAEAVHRAKNGGGDDDDDESMMNEDDHAFFVNVGDLEMEDGWEDQIEEDNDWLNSMKKSKGKKRKRTTKDGAASKSGSASGGANAQGKKPVKKTKPNPKKDATKSPNKNSGSGGGTAPKSDTKKKTSSGTNTASSSKTKINDDASTSNKATPKKETTAASTSDDEKKQLAKEKAEHKAKVDASRKEVTSLKRKSTRLYNKCVEEIQKMTAENLPRRASKGGTSKCQVKVPQGKSGGDTISFANPHIPGQRLKVKIPESKVADETFQVTVPLPEVKPGKKAENKFTKECIDALDKYSTVYDDWLQAEANHRTLVGNVKKKGKDAFKVGVERLKKYDQMILTFPKNLEVPIDAPFLRLLVRRKRQSQSKKSKMVKAESTPKKASPTTMMELKIPGKGVQFPEIKYQKSDFEPVS